MKKPDTYTILSLLISLLSLLSAVLTGFWGAQLASIVSVGIMMLTWGSWVTVKIVLIEKKINLNGTDDRMFFNKNISILPSKGLTHYKPIFNFLEECPITIDSLKKNIKYLQNF